jgi:hypothetical protein
MKYQVVSDKSGYTRSLAEISSLRKLQTIIYYKAKTKHLMVILQMEILEHYDEATDTVTILLIVLGNNIKRA